MNSHHVKRPSRAEERSPQSSANNKLTVTSSPGAPFSGGSVSTCLSRQSQNTYIAVRTALQGVPLLSKSKSSINVLELNLSRFNSHEMAAQSTITNAVVNHYSTIARERGTQDEPYAKKVAQSFGYTLEDLAAIPDGANMGLSCGNPLTIAGVKTVCPSNIPL